MSRVWVRIAIWGALLGAAGVLMGAFGAHALKSVLAENELRVYQTAVQYQMYHAPVIVLVSFLALHFRPQGSGSTILQWSARLFIFGIVLFCGSLYLLALTEWKLLGIITPFGGLALVLGWSMLALALIKSLKDCDRE